MKLKHINILESTSEKKEREEKFKLLKSERYNDAKDMKEYYLLERQIDQIESRFISPKEKSSGINIIYQTTKDNLILLLKQLMKIRKQNKKQLKEYEVLAKSIADIDLSGVTSMPTNKIKTIKIKFNSFFRQLTELRDELKTKLETDLNDNVVMKNLEENNILPGNNWIYDIGNIYVESQIHAGFFLMFPMDLLHSIYKGIIQQSIDWTMQCLFALEKINPDKYGGLISKVDKLIADFGRRNCINPCDLSDFVNGISWLYPLTNVLATKKRTNNLKNKKQTLSNSTTKKDKKKTTVNSTTKKDKKKTKPIMKSAKGTGMATGSLPANKMLGLLFMLLHSLDGLLPTRIPLPDGSSLKLRKQWNIRGVITNALQTTFEIAVMFKKNFGFTADDFDAFDSLICINKCHGQLLFELRNDLMAYSIKIDGPDIIAKVFEGHKGHLLEHLVLFMKLFGSDSNIFNTEISENYHIFIKGLILLLNNLLPTTKNFGIL